MSEEITFPEAMLYWHIQASSKSNSLLDRLLAETNAYNHAVNWACALVRAIKEHHDQKADDRCIEDDAKLYAAAGLPVHDCRVGDKGQMLQNCLRFIENRCASGGWPSYKELEEKIKKLEESRQATFNCMMENYDLYAKLQAAVELMLGDWTNVRERDRVRGVLNEIATHARKVRQTQDLLQVGQGNCPPRDGPRAGK